MKFQTLLMVSVVFLFANPAASSAQNWPSRDPSGPNPDGIGTVGNATKLPVPVDQPTAPPQTTVTFNVLVNVSQLEPEITSVAVACEVRSAAIIGAPSAYGLTSVSPGNGRVNTTAAVVVPIPRLDDPTGKSATYVCRLFGRRTITNGDKTNESQPSWELFSAGAAVSALRLTPDPAAITGSFNWIEAAPTASAPPNVTTTSPGGNP